VHTRHSHRLTQFYIDSKVKFALSHTLVAAGVRGAMVGACSR